MEVIGQFLEYYVETDYIGKVKCDKQDRRVGYYGKQYHVAESDLSIGKKKIRKGTKYMTIYYEMNGRD